MAELSPIDQFHERRLHAHWQLVIKLASSPVYILPSWGHRCLCQMVPSEYGCSLQHVSIMPVHTAEVSSFILSCVPLCFDKVEIYDLEDARLQVDHVIASAVRESKPVYINICCNLAAIGHPSFTQEPVPYAIAYKSSNERSLQAAIDAAAKFLNKATRPVIVSGVHVGTHSLHAKSVQQLCDPHLLLCMICDPLACTVLHG